MLSEKIVILMYFISLCIHSMRAAMSPWSVLCESVRPKISVNAVFCSDKRIRGSSRCLQQPVCHSQEGVLLSSLWLIRQQGIRRILQLPLSFHFNLVVLAVVWWLWSLKHLHCEIISRDVYLCRRSYAWLIDKMYFSTFYTFFITFEL